MSGIPSRDEAKHAFNCIDKDGNGMISPSELAAFLEQNSTVKSQEMMDWFSDIDKDGDEKISLDELLNEVLKKPRAKAIEKAFKDMDCDGSGTLKKDEVLDEGPKCGLTDIKTLETCFAAMDKDNSNYVEKDEFMDYMNGNY